MSGNYLMPGGETQSKLLLRIKRRNTKLNKQPQYRQ